MHKILKGVSKYWWIGLLSAKSNLAYLPEVLSRLLFLVAILYVFLRLWQFTYAQTGSHLLGGLTIVQMLWYLTFTEAIAMSGPRVSQLVDEDVRTGSVVVQLIKPFSYPLYRLSTNLGERFIRFAVNLVAGALVTTFFIGPLVLDWRSLPLYLTAVSLAFVIDFLCQFCIGLGAFWLEDTSGLLLIYSRLAMVLGGLLMPVDLFPEGMQKLAHLLPFWTIYGAAKVFVASDLSVCRHLLETQAATIVVAAGFTFFLYHCALKRVAANGG